jgi:hypothetical protein
MIKFKQFCSFRSMMIASFAAATLLAIGAGKVMAQTQELPSAKQVFVGGTFFLTLRAPSGGLTPEQRAAVVQERINHALSMGPVYPEDITVGMLDGDYVVLLKGKRLYTADALTAKAESTTERALAQKWAAYLQQTLPQLTAPTNPKTTAPAS